MLCVGLLCCFALSAPSAMSVCLHVSIKCLLGCVCTVCLSGLTSLFVEVPILAVLCACLTRLSSCLICLSHGDVCSYLVCLFAKV